MNQVIIVTIQQKKNMKNVIKKAKHKFKIVFKNWIHYTRDWKTLYFAELPDDLENSQLDPFEHLITLNIAPLMNNIIKLNKKSKDKLYGLIPMMCWLQNGN